MLYCINVGKEYNLKVNLFKKIENCCYDKENGLLYSSDLNVFTKLRLNINEVVEVNQNNNENLKKEIKQIQENYSLIIEDLAVLLKNQNKAFQQNADSKVKVEKVIFKNKEQIEALQKTMQEILEIQEEKQQIEETEKLEIKESFETLKTSIGILNKKNKTTKQETEELQNKFESLIEIVAESKKQQEVSLDFDTLKHMDIKQIWKKFPNKGTAALISLMMLSKRELEEKGLRV
jgi:hypothetical protein